MCRFFGKKETIIWKNHFLKLNFWQECLLCFGDIGYTSRKVLQKLISDLFGEKDLKIDRENPRVFKRRERDFPYEYGV